VAVLKVLAAVLGLGFFLLLVSAILGMWRVSR
jgi:cytochrome oxidase assembly protein ShyY1